MSDFGLKPAEPGLLERLGLSKHIVGLVKSQRGLLELFTETGISKPFYVYTGRGPSQSTMHIGHLPGLYLALEMGLLSGKQIYFMLSDDEKSLRDGAPLASMRENARSTIKQLEKLGFTETNTNFRLNSSGMDASFYEIVLRIASAITPSVITHVFGEKSNIGEMFYPAIQMAPCFLGNSANTCVVIAGEDQDPFFRVARDIARRLGYTPPIILYTQTVPGLDGTAKMSTSVPASRPIFLTDDITAITEAVNYIKLVGNGTTAELFERGSDLSIDIPYKIFHLFCRDDELMETVTEAYTRGIPLEHREKIYMLSSHVKLSPRLVNAGRQFIGARNMRDLLIQLLEKILKVVP